MKIPEIRIHSWGGLGSQLFAVATAFQVHRKIPWRRVVILSHSSGVTFRSLEVDYQNEWLRFEFKDDYTDKSSNLGSIQEKPRIKLSEMIKKIFTGLGFMNSLNNDNQIKGLKPWVLSVRGHYSHKKIDLETLNFLSGVLSISSTGGIGNQRIGLHYRLGDLLALETKSFISEKDLIKVVAKIRVDYSVNQVDVFSDSQQQASSLLSPLEPSLRVVSLETLATIKSLLDYEIFVGTNSKISIWVTLLRLNIDPHSIIFLPDKSQQELSRILPNHDTWENLYFFDCSSR
jgi:hypothetical protein